MRTLRTALEAAHRLTGAPEITAYAVRRGATAPDGRSHSHAELTDPDGRSHRVGLSTGEAFAFTAAPAIAALPGTAIEPVR